MKLNAGWRVSDIYAELISQARAYAKQHGHTIQLLLNDASRLPSRYLIYRLKDMLNKAKGSTSGLYEDWMPDLVKFSKEYEETEAGKQGARIKVWPMDRTRAQSPCCWAIAIVTDLMIRVHRYFVQAGQRMCFDGVHCLVKSDDNVVQFSAYTVVPCSALPLFHILTNSKKADVIVQGLRLVREIFEALSFRAFGGRGARKEAGPENIVLDGAWEEEIAVEVIWLSANVFLCEFHHKRKVLIR